MDKQVFVVMMFPDMTYGTLELTRRIEEIRPKTKDLTPVSIHSVIAHGPTVYVTIGWWEWAERTPTPDPNPTTQRRKREKIAK